MTKSLQTNPEDTETDCYKATFGTNALLDEMFKAETYKDGEINSN